FDDVGDVGLADPGDRTQRRFDLLGVDRGALELEHVVEPPAVPEVAIGIDGAEVARRVEAVGVEGLLARATQDAAHDVGPPDANRTGGGWRTLGAGFGVADPDLDAVEREAAAAALVLREVDVEPARAVRAERLRHPEQVGPRARGRALLGPEQGRQAPGTK